LAFENGGLTMRSISVVLLLVFAVEARAESTRLNPADANKSTATIVAGALTTERQAEPRGKHFKQNGQNCYLAPNGEVYVWVPGYWKRDASQVLSNAPKSTTTGIRTVIPKREPAVRVTYPDRTSLGFSNHYYFEGDGHFTD
jgi:hypothetical protein